MKRIKFGAFAFLVAMAAVSCQNPASNNNFAVSRYKIVIEASNFSYTDVNAHIYDPSGTLSNATVTVDGTPLPRMSGNYYYTYFNPIWTGGSAHSYRVDTLDGATISGTVIEPTGVVSGVTYSPAKGTLATTYTISPPAGVWMAGTTLECLVGNGGTTWAYYEHPSGTSPIVVSYDKLNGATSVTFSAYFANTANLVGCAAGSQISVAGTKTIW